MTEGLSCLKKDFIYDNITFTVETGRLAGQANGSVLITSGGTCVLVTATGTDQPREGIDFFPLTVDYEEKLYAVGKIPGGFIKREGRPSEKAILSCRLIDRPIRPLFPEGYKNDVQIVATVLSVDQNHSPDVAAMIGASCALSVSDIPFLGPIGAVNVGMVDGEIVLSPNLEEQEKSTLDLVVAGTKNAVTMVEAGAEELSKEVVLEAIMRGHEAITKIVEFAEEFRQEALEKGFAKEKLTFESESLDDELSKKISNYAAPIIKEAIDKFSAEKVSKAEREKEFKNIKLDIYEYITNNMVDPEEITQELKNLINGKIGEIEKQCLREKVAKEKIRIDGRSPEEIRHVTGETGLLPRTHGSGLFIRGETQVLTVTTLGAVGDEQIIEGLGVEESKRYMHHYNFPPFSVGEAKPMRGPGRREVGHGALAERALEPVIPSEEEFPYTIRLVSEIISSNGSTSMGSVCGSTLSLMDAGVPIQEPVSGVAMGLIKEKESVAILSDIQGIEDALGDMDFKVAGTKKGITALQMDIKMSGISKEILRDALDQAAKGYLYILDKMQEIINEPRKELSPYAPRIIRKSIDPDKIRDIIGPGGKMIRKIIEETGAKIDIQDDGTVFIASEDKEGMEKAIEYIDNLSKDVEVGKNYLGKVTRITDYGAFVEVIPGVLGSSGKEGLVHISQLAPEHVDKVEDIVKEGEKVLVKATGHDHLGRLKLSRKDALSKEELEKAQKENKKRSDKKDSKSNKDHKKKS